MSMTDSFFLVFVVYLRFVVNRQANKLWFRVKVMPKKPLGDVKVCLISYAEQIFVWPFSIRQFLFLDVLPITPCSTYMQYTHKIAYISKIQLVVYYQCCVLADWLNCYQAICYSALVAKSACFLAPKNEKASFNQLKLFCLDIFDQLVGFY